MAHIFVKNSLSNLKAAKIDINLPMYVSTNSDGDPVWLLEVATTYPSASGTKIRPEYINSTIPFEELDSAISDAVGNISAKIDWGTLVEDNDPPYITHYGPEGAEVSIASNIDLHIQEDTPSAGIDLSEVDIILNTGSVDLDITPECTIHGTPFGYDIHWEPSDRKTKHYQEE